MNISGVSAPTATDATTASIGATASIRVLDMAQEVFEDVASQLIDELSNVITGLGENIDMSI